LIAYDDVSETSGFDARHWDPCTYDPLV